MLVHKPDDEGFGLVEVIIAMFLLAIIALAILPALTSGIVVSSQQSTVATATRQLNALVEQARQSPTCTSLGAIPSQQFFTDGAGRSYEVDAVVGSCSSGSTTRVIFTATQTGTPLGAVNSFIYVP